jgi:hypothetical protein
LDLPRKNCFRARWQDSWPDRRIGSHDGSAVLLAQRGPRRAVDGVPSVALAEKIASVVAALLATEFLFCHNRVSQRRKRHLENDLVCCQPVFRFISFRKM